MKRVRTTRCPLCGTWYAAAAAPPGSRCNDASDGDARCRGRVVDADTSLVLETSRLFEAFSPEKRERMAAFLADVQVEIANKFMPRGDDEFRAEKGMALGMAAARIQHLVEDLLSHE